MTQMRLDEIISTRKGHAFKSKWYSDAGISIVKVSNLTEDSVDTSNLTCIPNEIAKDYMQYSLRTDDIVIQTVGSWPSNPASVVGKVVRIPSSASGALLNQNAVRIDPDDRVHKKFLYYLLKDNLFKDYIVGCAQGAASQASITLDAIRGFKFELPLLSTQCTIAAVLSAYDDLIENNTRRIQILEEMAQAIYREWFVHFRFPGHEGVRMIDSGSELGEVPEGWETGSYTDFIDVMSGGTPKTKVPEYWEGEFPWFTPKDLSNSFYVFDTERKITDLGLSKCNSKLYPPNSVFITARGTVGRCTMNAVPMAMSQTSYALLGRENISQYFVFLLTLNMVDILKKQATGAVFDTIIVDTFRMQNIFIPKDVVLRKFDLVMSPIFHLVKTLQLKNAYLRATRDVLLPKLVSGEVDVSELEIGVETVHE